MKLRVDLLRVKNNEAKGFLSENRKAKVGGWMNSLEFIW